MNPFESLNIYNDDDPMDIWHDLRDVYEDDDWDDLEDLDFEDFESEDEDRSEDEEGDEDDLYN